MTYAMALPLRGGFEATMNGVTPRVKALARSPHARLALHADRRWAPMKLKGRTALVTGGSRGIGRAIALALAEEGADVAINYVSSEPAAKAIAEQIRKIGRHSMLAQADVGDYPDSVRGG